MRDHHSIPRSYASAARLLFGRRVQRLPLHDDLTLSFVDAGVAVVYRGKPIVTWTRDGRRVVVDAPTGSRGVGPLVAGYISWFVPSGYGVGRRNARLILNHPTGVTTAGNRQVIALPEALDYYDPF